MIFKNDFKKLILLLSQKSLDIKQIRFFGTDDNIIEFFKENWDNVSVRIQRNMIFFATDTSPEIGIKILVKGYRSFTNGVRYDAKVALGKIITKIKIPLGATKEEIIETSASSSKFASVIYNEIKFFRSIGDKKFYIQILLKSGGRGPYYVWKYFLTVSMPYQHFVDIINSLPDLEKLVFAYQYTLMGNSNRQKFFISIEKMLQGVKKRAVIVNFFADLYDMQVEIHPLFAQLALRLQLDKVVTKTELSSKLFEKNVIGLKVMALVNRKVCYNICLNMLSSNKHSLNKSPLGKVIVLSVLARIYKMQDENKSIIKIVLPFINDNNDGVVISAFKVLAVYKISNIEQIVLTLLLKRFELIEPICKIISNMNLSDVRSILDYVVTLPEGVKIREQFELLVATKFLQNNPEKMIACINVIENIEYPEFNNIELVKKEILQFKDAIELAIQKESKHLSDIKLPDKAIALNNQKRFLGKFFDKGQKKNIIKLMDTLELGGSSLQGETIQDLDLSGCKLTDVDFRNVNMKNVNMKGANLIRVSFNGARMKSVDFDGAVFNCVTFEKSYLLNVSFKKANMQECCFNNAWVCDSSFKFASMAGTLFIDAIIKKTDFTNSILNFSSFATSKLECVLFAGASLTEFDFCGTCVTLCNFDGVEILNVSGTKYANLNVRSPLFSELEIPLSLCHVQRHVQHQGQNSNKKLLTQTAHYAFNRITDSWFGLLLGFMEMDKQAKIFANYNMCRLELAIDTLRSNQAELFELIPFIISTKLDVLPNYKPDNNTPSGIFNYFPSLSVIKLAEKYLPKFQGKIPLHKDAYAVHGLFTVGSTGSIAQTIDSNIDYWVCIDKLQLGEINICLLHDKLNALEKWAMIEFNIRINFYLMDIFEIREDRFGDSDYASSDLAYATILKEEFYRTMIHIAGKIPFWCIYPSELDDLTYTPLYDAVSSYYPYFFDLGNVSDISTVEYLSASMWQIFKNLKNPFNVIMKVAMIEKCIHDKKIGKLSCNLLKERWRSGAHNFIDVDSYILLFEQVEDYYKKVGLNDSKDLVSTCFFLNLGIESLEDLNTSKMGLKKHLIYQCMSVWNWSEKEIENSIYFNNWLFKRVSALGNQMNEFMLQVFKRVSSFVEKSSHWESIKTSQDIIVLGKKVYVRLTEQQFKIKKNPMILQFGSLITEIYLNYREKNRGEFVWEALQKIKKREQRDKDGNRYEVICEKSRIEEIAAWFVYNGLYLSDIRFILKPNPTSVVHQDVIELFKEMNNFFQMIETEEISVASLLEKPVINKMFVIVNFGLSRTLRRIYKYSLVYSNSWGEVFCRTFANKQGLDSIRAVLSKSAKLLGTPLHLDKTVSFIPRSALKRLRNK
ncbi:MAG: hypothetical protein B6I31_00375 [Desulfobacteraceae bacterium 4572_19]|nr:MAG: hypothetical protein B6I31_00375 [Desulfobacteraceae bacterium 4572_19]